MGIAPGAGGVEERDEAAAERGVPEGAPGLSYADLAVAVLDEIETPTRHRERASVFVPRDVRRAAER
ncbi:hypothetical protein ACGFY9_08575 [Streptomyces sp. NPDC048504]|uniref:hypothetical protein n=1 Tax=Streptomyces sp. NPDC048504 TaxID=3365559 RepID=UPI00371D2EA1